MWQWMLANLGPACVFSQVTVLFDVNSLFEEQYGILHQNKFLYSNTQTLGGQG